mmetsp:Transcript_1543/g.3480  ORF Transcript_1543/g.3480 Transcript_1543/m.3480 type:complete len:139 (+) Transcript_1543:248-664(+)
MDVFWKGHNPTYSVGDRQYMNAVWFHNDSQEAAARETAATEAQRRNASICTVVEKASTFTLAEDYHQKYYLRGRPELQALFPADAQGLADSIPAARVNGFAGGHGSKEQLEAEANSLGLSEQALTSLRGVVGSRPSRF